MIRLHDYYRSSASYRVRIALNLKGLAFERHDVSLIKGEQKSPENLARNPQGFVPTLEIDGLLLSQSLAIIDYLDARHPEPPLFPTDAGERARVMAQTLVIAADIHPLGNLRVLNYLRDDLAVDQEKRIGWSQHWIAEGFTALETAARDAGRFLGGDHPNAADIFLVPQMYNARRFELRLDAFPNLVRIDKNCCALAPFNAAHPDHFAPAG